MAISLQQIELIRSALGLRYSKKMYRNYFYTHDQATNYKPWMDLVDKGYAKVEHDTDNNSRMTFYVTESGKKWVTQ